MRSDLAGTILTSGLIAGVYGYSYYNLAKGAMTSLDINSDNDIRCDGGKALFAALNGNQVMKEINVASNNLAFNASGKDISGVIAIGDAIPTMGALASLDLSQNNIPTREMGPIERLCESKQIALRK